MSRPVQTTNPSQVVPNQAVNDHARRRSTRIAAAAPTQSTMPITAPMAQSACADHDQARITDLAQPAPSLLKLLSRLPPNFTSDDIHACEDAVLNSGGYVYLDVVLPYYQDAEARRLGTTKGELDRTSALLEFQFGKDVGGAAFARGIEALKEQARVKGR